jgi:hypothetical protein
MTFEERMDRLAERHEALAQSVEMLHRDILDLKVTVAGITAVVEKDGENIRALAGIAEVALDSIRRLESIAAAHNDRIERLEDRQ